jgi:hypothetical protein
MTQTKTTTLIIYGLGLGLNLSSCMVCRSIHSKAYNNECKHTNPYCNKTLLKGGNDTQIGGAFNKTLQQRSNNP